ncbi:MAG TPA: 2-oxo acid dehydrogenase subunit E2 [Candidatus Dormibacteraeota bacterium]|nr:2-oxo acid dehydrogenase subunit E2 [Candidatus Dormibacteraeota bacterium]
MAVEVVMPALATGRSRARLVRWLKREGDVVSRGEPLLEVETEKAVVEVESPGTGVLSGVRVREGEEAAAGSVLAYVLAPSPRPGPGGAGLARAADERASRSWREVPHLFLFRDVDASQLIVAAARQPAGVTPTDLLLRLVAVTLAGHPALRGGGGDEVHVALTMPAADARAVAVVVGGADRLDLPALAALRADLESRARTGELRPSEVTGAGFAVTDLSTAGADAVLPLVAEGRTAALVVGRVADRVVPVRGRPQVRPMATLTLACDHRTVDSAGAARFLGDLADAIEEPARSL